MALAHRWHDPGAVQDPPPRHRCTSATARCHRPPPRPPPPCPPCRLVGGGVPESAAGAHYPECAEAGVRAHRQRALVCARAASRRLRAATACWPHKLLGVPGAVCGLAGAAAAATAMHMRMPRVVPAPCHAIRPARAALARHCALQHLSLRHTRHWQCLDGWRVCTEAMAWGWIGGLYRKGRGGQGRKSALASQH